MDEHAPVDAAVAASVVQHAVRAPHYSPFALCALAAAAKGYPDQVPRSRCNNLMGDVDAATVARTKIRGAGLGGEMRGKRGGRQGGNGVMCTHVFLDSHMH